jgi:hypothetical protein
MSTFRLCPACGSSKVTTDGMLDSSSAKCKVCAWAGTSNDLVLHEIDPDRLYAIALAVARDYLCALAKLAAVPIGQAMTTSGLVDGSESKMLARLIRAAIGGAHKATLEEIEKIQLELSNVKPA